jgi:hypothetical protein
VQARPVPSPRPPGAEPRAKAPPRERPKPRGPTELELVETQITEREEAVAELERELAEDWSDVDKLAEHRRARDELQALLARWESLFEEAQT